MMIPTRRHTPSSTTASAAATTTRITVMIVTLVWKILAVIIVCSSIGAFKAAEAAEAEAANDRIPPLEDNYGMVSGPAKVEFEYQLEVKNNNSPGPGIGQSSAAATTTTTRKTASAVLQDIDSRILLELQSRLPSNKLFNFSAPVIMTTMVRTDSNSDSDNNNASSSSSSSISRREERPNVRFQKISSEVVSPCFISSDVECIIVKSMLEIEFDGLKPEYAIERVAVHFLQDYFQEYYGKNTNNNKEVTITYLYPFFVTTNVEFDLIIQSPAATVVSVTSDEEEEKNDQQNEEQQQQQQQQPFGDVEKWVLEQSFKDVFGVIVDVVEGDTKILDADYVYRQVSTAIKEEEKEESTVAVLSTSTNNKTDSTTAAAATSNTTIITTTMTTTTTTTTTTTMNIQILGECRSCSKSDFASFVNPIIVSSLEVFRMKLIENGGIAQSTTYFDNITSVEFGIPTLPQIIPTEHEELYSGQLPEVQKVTYPGLLSLGICLTVFILIGGACFIRRELKYYAEDDDDDSEYSTSSESRDDPSSVGVDDNSANPKSQDATTTVKDPKKVCPDPVQTCDIQQKPSGGGGTLTTYENDSILDDTLASPRDYSRPRYHRGGGGGGDGRRQTSSRPPAIAASRLDPAGMIHDLREYQFEEDGSIQIDGPSQYV